MTLSWESPDDDSVTGYQILRRRPTQGEDTLLVYVEDTGSTATTYTDANVSAGIRHVYRVKAISTAGLSQRSNYVNVTPLEHQESTQNTPAAGQPTIVGTARVGETLTADTTGIEDEDGLRNASFSYQWVVTDGGAKDDIPGATGASYTLVAADMGLSILVQVSFTDDAGNREALTSAATDVVTAAPQPNSPATGAPAITGTARVGETLTADTSAISDDEGMENAVFSYQWMAGDSDIQGATESSYTLTENEQGTSVRV